MKMDLYKLEVTSGNYGTRTFVETIEAADEGECRLAAMKKHTGTSMDDYEYFRTFYRLFEHGETVQTENVKFGRDLLSKMSEMERSSMCEEEKDAHDNL